MTTEHMQEGNNRHHENSRCKTLHRNNKLQLITRRSSPNKHIRFWGFGVSATTTSTPTAVDGKISGSWSHVAPCRAETDNTLTVFKLFGVQTLRPLV